MIDTSLKLTDHKWILFVTTYSDSTVAINMQDVSNGWYRIGTVCERDEAHGDSLFVKES